MKMTDKKKPINTMPEGIWESTNPAKNKPKKKGSCSVTTDLQGNGYPTNKKSD